MILCCRTGLAYDAVYKAIWTWWSCWWQRQRYKYIIVSPSPRCYIFYIRYYLINRNKSSKGRFKEAEKSKDALVKDVSKDVVNDVSCIAWLLNWLISNIKLNWGRMHKTIYNCQATRYLRRRTHMHKCLRWQAVT